MKINIFIRILSAPAVTYDYGQRPEYS